MLELSAFGLSNIWTTILMPLSTTDDFCRALRDVLSKSFNLEINSVAPLSGEYSESFRLTTVNEDYVAKVGQGSEARALREMLSLIHI